MAGKKRSKKDNKGSPSERYRITINSRKLNKVLKPIVPRVRSSLIQIALAQWLSTKTGRSTVQVLNSDFIPIGDDDGDPNMKELLNQSTGDF